MKRFNMKKIVMTGIIVILVLMFMGTCDSVLPVEEEEIVYTDVEYSKDGSQVTVYLDGITVPVAKKSQRAMSVDLAEMAYDFLEVVFVAGTNGIARTSWELGEPAGISGVYRAAATDYSPLSGGTCAAMFAGKSAGKTLLGVGGITSHTDGVGTASVAGGEISNATTSITFSLRAITTGLQTIDDASVTGRPTQIRVNSFKTFSATTPAPGNITSSLLPLGNSKVPYPLYTMPTTTVAGGAEYKAVYEFFLSGGNPAASWGAVFVDTIPTSWKVLKKREPRFVDGGTYRQPKDKTDTATAAVVTNPTANAVFNPLIPITFTVSPKSAGLFSFLLEIPVFMVTKTPAGRSGDLGAITWYIRTGYGADLYNLDDGISSGGCVLMGVGASSSDWIDIDWEWVSP